MVGLFGVFVLSVLDGWRLYLFSKPGVATRLWTSLAFALTPHAQKERIMRDISPATMPRSRVMGCLRRLF